METPKEAAVNIAHAYYEAVANKDTNRVASLLHSDVQLIGPLGNAAGKAAVLQAVTLFANLLKSLRIMVSFGSREQAMVSYEVDFGEPFGVCRSAALVSVRENVVERIELFFDARPFEKHTA